MSPTDPAGPTGPTGPTDEWSPVCRLAELEVGRGVRALVHGQAMAVFRIDDVSVHALGDHDPFERGARLSRGIVGLRGETPFVASPRHRKAFDLRTGRCLDDEHAVVPAYEVRVVEGVVLVGRRLPLVEERREETSELPAEHQVG
jgi:nitrite reductase (NADH) small subunit